MCSLFSFNFKGIKLCETMLLYETMCMNEILTIEIKV